jgi:hypothetical protein
MLLCLIAVLPFVVLLPSCCVVLQAITMTGEAHKLQGADISDLVHCMHTSYGGPLTVYGLQCSV